MDETNPYESPQHIQNLAPQNVKPHTASIRVEAKRGAKLGAIVAGGFALFVALMLGLIEASSIYRRYQSSKATPRFPYDATSDIATALFRGFLGVSAFTLLGIIVGAAIMSLAALMNKNKNAKR
jgi:hypothetical protein